VRSAQTTVGVVVHGDSTVSGHGPGVSPLLSAPDSLLNLVHDSNANLAAVFDVRRPATPRDYTPLPWKDRGQKSSNGSPRNYSLPTRSNGVFTIRQPVK